jgi:spoIIIJ-associated protein
MKKTEEIIKKTAEELLQLLEIEKPTVELRKDEQGVFHVAIETTDSGILIGYHGENVYALQLILSLIVYKKTNQWQRLVLDIGDWRKKREEQLKRMALGAAQRVKFSQEPVIMPYLNSVERRIIHLALAENPDVTTRSEGESRERRLVIEPRKK